MSARYREFQPPLRLQPFVECFWAVEPGRPLPEYPVLPDGCADIVYSPSMSRELQLVGVMTRARKFALSGRFEFGVRFRPGMSSVFLPVPGVDTTDQAIALSDIGCAAARGLADRMAEAQSPAACAGIIETLLRDPRETSLVQRLCAAIVRRAGLVRMDDLALQAGLSARQLRRLFLEQVGLSPKLFCRIIRFRGSLARLPREPRADWAQVALECGYYDQAHFIHEFRQFSGCTPLKYAALER